MVSLPRVVDSLWLAPSGLLCPWELEGRACQDLRKGRHRRRQGRWKLESLQDFWRVLDTHVVMCVLASLLLASGRVLCFTALCFSAPQEGGSSVRVSLAPRVAETSVSVDPEKLCLVGQFYV